VSNRLNRSQGGNEMSSPKAVINVTPLIDILLVLLIMFMVISPMKSSKFEAKIPQEAQSTDPVEPNPKTLIVKINSDATLDLNSTRDFGTIDSPEKLILKLKNVFVEREKNNPIDANLNDENGDAAELIQRTVFIKAPRSLGYGKVVKVIDAVKIAGAKPISLQLDDLD